MSERHRKALIVAVLLALMTAGWATYAYLEYALTLSAR